MLPLIYTGNDKMFDGILISLLSATKHNAMPLDVYILTMDMSDKNPDYLPFSEEHRVFLENMIKETNGESRITLLDVGDLYAASMLASPNNVTKYTPYCFLRLFSDKLDCLPDKVLYLDTDTVINGDIGQLYDINIDGYEFAGALDYYGRWFFDRRYINSGVLLINLKKIRETGLFERTLEMCAKKRIFLPDQTALNKFAKNKLIISSVYNEQKHFKDGTIIQHFSKTILWLPFFHTRNIKPWQVDEVKNVLTHKYDDILDSYVELKNRYTKG